MSAPAALPRARPRAAADGALVLPVAAARALAFGALAAWGAEHWMSMLEPAAPGRGWAVLGVAAAAVGALLAAGRLRGRRRALAVALAAVPLGALTLLAGGVAASLLAPPGWGELAGGIARGVDDLPGVRVPYRGLDPWVRTVIPLAGAVLAVVAALLAFWPRRAKLGFPAAALALLVALYAIPVVALDFGAEFLRGAVLALLTIAFLQLETLRRPDAAAAATLALLATAVALIAAPALNRDRPWFDYETWAAETSTSKSTAFTWEHAYGGLSWPRDGRELLRVTARRPAYWKAENLDQFDGTVWRRSRVTYPVADVPNDRPQVVRNGTQTIKVAIRNLHTDSYVTAGYASALAIPHLRNVHTPDGLYVPPRTLRRGDAYTVTVYTPQPTAAQRRRAGDRYPRRLRQYTTIQTAIRGTPGASRVSMTFPYFGADPDDIRYGPPRTGTPLEALATSGLDRVYGLARRLAAGASTPDAVVQRVLAYLGSDRFTYSELPPAAAATLPGFLLDARQGYCEHFSGAMALLLRMAGIPARVVTGFSTGATDTRTGEYVVRDFDAHSWVEVYYPRWGWVTFDPTPADSPARSQPADAAAASTAGSAASTGFAGDPVDERGAGVAVATASAPRWRLPALAAGPLALLAALWLALRRRRRGPRLALPELERALERSGRAPPPGTTLHALELRFAHRPAAAGYMRALRESRYGGVPGRPTRAQRAGLRAELARGGGILGRLRAWWALPPR